MTFSDTIKVRFDDPATDELGTALQHNHAARHQGVWYWVVAAEYKKNGVGTRPDYIVFKVVPDYFSPCPALS